MSIRHVAAAALTTLALAGCGTAETPATDAPPAEAGKLSVVTSTNVYGSIAEAVAGDRAVVTSLITDPAADPHSYESTPAAAASVAEAAVVVYNGGGYDDWMSQVVESAGGERTVIDVAQLSGLETADGEFNEHFWYSLPTVQKLTTQLATDLGAADPAHAAEFTANATAFNGSVTELLAKAQAIGTEHPGARVAITEPVPGYLIESAGLTDVTPPEFAEAIEEDTDPPAAVLQETLALFSAQPVEALILNAQTETPTTDQVRQAAQTGGVPIVEVTETLPAGATGYTAWMGGQIDALAGALGQG